MKKIKLGFTNESYKDEKFFVQKKIPNQFNHKIDYSILSSLDFVPKLFENSKQWLKFEFIENIDFELTDQVLIQIADYLKTIHNSKLPFPKTNHAARVKQYRKVLKDKNIQIEILNKYYKRINLILSKMENNRPLHNDLFKTNILMDKNQKLWIVDWEYASMGDKHFDLAYFITSNNLNKHQEKVFLDRYESYWEEYLYQHKILIYYLIILWLNNQETMPFDDKPFYQLVEQSVQEYENKKKNNEFAK
ncbi:MULTISPECIES: phosphotransferase [unclassified Mycoplasma]|uniref:phosphotransferase n=1 Tax=unclassified Mycoplasma TaxID=2683645 RepID=UPI00211CD101|nr:MULTISPECIES: phosphotransferase [unclassified Mycoplasma]UUM19803.1 phosphotransferase [Mycoplasma sp. 1578d]UUM24787.1 phosphotransferase [Mycoplasma sp. 3686d]